MKQVKALKFEIFVIFPIISLAHAANITRIVNSLPENISNIPDLKHAKQHICLDELGLVRNKAHGG